jgi:hypothetical protein
MTEDPGIIELGQWLRTPAGRYLLRWELEQLDRAVADRFGFHAVQLGLPELDGLRANRMPHRWVTSELPYAVPEPIDMPPPDADEGISTQSPPLPVALYCDCAALPFPSQSVDLVVMPHTLELTAHPHAALREVERVLRPEGRVVIVGLNPASLWGLRQRAGRLRSHVGVSRGPLFLPQAGEFIGYWRLRDWLRLLGLEVERGRFGCWRPAFASQAWLDRFAWIEPIGDRWWPVLGAVYFLVAVKRVPGMRLMGLARRERAPAQAAPAVVAQRDSVASPSREFARESAADEPA